MAQTNPSFAPDLHDADLRRAVLAGLALDSSAISMFRLMLKQYWQLSGLRQQVAEQDQALLVNNPDSYRLMTVPGIGPTNALTAIPEAGDLRRFDPQFLKFCLTNLSTQQSGAFAARAGCPSTATHACAPYFGWLLRPRYGCAKTVCGANSRIILTKTRLIQICAARLIPRSLPSSRPLSSD